MSNYAVRAEGLSKRYRIEPTGKRTKRRRRIADSASDFMRGILNGSAFRSAQAAPGILWALKDVEFEVEHGNPLGVIGANGAGKTTLLKILARITSPTEGRARLRGRVGSLLEVGTGFHSELTGRENVYLNGAVLGMRRREIARKFDAIVDFSGVEAFIETPLKFYSSGMRMRLAFSVAAHLEPEILLVDEVLAVGDLAFQNKCLNKMQEVTTEGRTVLFVSHNLGAVKSLCPQSMLLEGGRLAYFGETAAAMDKYVESRERASTEEAPAPRAAGSTVLGVSTCDGAGGASRRFGHDEPVHCRIRASLAQTGFGSRLTLKIYSGDMQTVLATNDFEPSGSGLVPTDPGTYTFDVRIPSDLLVPGRYYVGAELAHRKQRSARPWRVTKADHFGEFEVYDNGSVLSRLSIPWQGLVHSDAIRWRLLDGLEHTSAVVGLEQGAGTEEGRGG